MKRLLTLALAILMVLSLVACNADNGTVADTSADTAIDTSEDTSEATGDVTIAQIVDGIKEMLGENYLPNMDIDAEILSATYGVDSAWVEEFVAQVPMISFNIDTLIAVKAKDGHAADVENALKSYLEYQIENSIQYPVNVPKLEAVKVYAVDNYVFYICLGIIPEEYIDDEEGAYKVAVENNDKVVAKINEILGK